MGNGQGPFKRQHGKCAQEVFLVATAEDILRLSEPQGQASANA